MKSINEQINNYWKQKLDSEKFKCLVPKCKGELNIYHHSVSYKKLYTECERCKAQFNISYKK